MGKEKNRKKRRETERGITRIGIPSQTSEELKGGAKCIRCGDLS